MAELTGLELRKVACEALGWTVVRDTEWLNLYDADKRKRNTVWGPSERNTILLLWELAPAIESDPAVSETMFLEWVAKHGYWWDLTQSGTGAPVICEVWMDGAMWSSEGATPSEARARCIVTASRDGR